MRETISQFMTPNPRTIGRQQTLQVAHDIMRSARIRHLPVLEQGKLVGIVSLRDLHLVETLKGVNPAEVLVEEAMTESVFAVSPRASLATVVGEMEKHKYGSAVVVDGDRVVGLFTTIDALRVLAGFVASAGAKKGVGHGTSNHTRS